MAILEAPTHKATPVSTPASRSARDHRLGERLPVLALGVLVTLCVGYGIGTMNQFDRDWRQSAPVHVASVDGVASPGTPLDEAVGEALATSSVPVANVQCVDHAVVQAEFAAQMCRAEGASGMVSILTSGAQGALHVAVYSGR